MTRDACAASMGVGRRRDQSHDGPIRIGRYIPARSTGNRPIQEEAHVVELDETAERGGQCRYECRDVAVFSQGVDD